MKKLVWYLKELMKEFSKDNVPLLAAAQAYYYLLSLIPLLILLLAILPYLNINTDTAIQAIEAIMPGELGEIFQEQIVSILTVPQGGLLTVGIIATIWTASNGMNAFIKAQNEAYNVTEIRSFWKARLVSTGLTLGLIVAMIIALILPVFGNAIIAFVDSIVTLPEETEILFQILRWTVSIVIIATVVASLYYIAPNIKIPFKYALPGAAFTTIAWQLMSLGFSIYISNFASYSETYGSLGGVVILMVWFFLIGNILVIGAEINAIHYRAKKGSTPGQD
ncbi:YihY/virulence factor BrkB family protein [Salipaludibacillus sp. HK11]|uniref:YihY/virulence factor BrkB family protein n=1 Tax=Salipaludibacillus sp. HK11 TaxID=3394320 RepID=UPI0039FD3E7C